MITASMKKIRAKYLVGFIQSGSRESQDALDFSNTDGLIPSIGGEHVNAEGGVEIPDNKFVSREYFLANPKSHIKQDDILLVKDGATIGKLGISKIPTELAANEHVYIIRSKDSVNQKWLYYLLRSDQVQSDIKLAIRGSAQGGLSKDFLNLQVQNIEEERQQKIAKFLDQKVARIDEAIAKKKKLITLLEEKRSTSITQAITKGLDKRVKLKDSNISWLGKIPNHWETKKLKFIGKTIIGLTFDPTDIVSNENEGTALLRANNISNGRINRVDIVYVKTSVPDKLITKDGDILICSRSGSRDLIGKCAKIDSKTTGATFGVFMTVFRSKHNDYIYYVLNSNIFKFQTGRFLTSTINQLTQATLNGFEVPFPPKEEQKEIVEYLNEVTQTIEKAKSKIKESIELLEEYKTSLISNAVTGKVKI
jgi:type I restriction enzyme S subunit